MVQLLEPLGDSARLHLESCSFRSPGDLLERLDKIRNQPDQEGRLLEPLRDPTEDNMELEEEPQGDQAELHTGAEGGEPEKHPEELRAGQQGQHPHHEAGHDGLQGGPQGRGGARHDGLQEELGDQEAGHGGPRGGLQTGHQGAREVPQAPGVWLQLEQDGSMSIRRGRDQVSSSPVLRRSRSQGLNPPLPNGLEVVSITEGAVPLRRPHSVHEQGQEHMQQAGRGRGRQAEQHPHRAQEELPRAVGRGRGRGQHRSAEVLRPRSPVVLGIDDVFVTIPRPQQGPQQLQPQPQQPQHHPQAQALQQQPQQGQQLPHEMRGVAGNNGQQMGRGRARGRARRARSSSLERTQQRLDMVVGQQRRLAREIRETKAQVEHLGVQRIILEQERRRSVSQMMGRGQPISATIRPQGSARQILQLPAGPQSRDPRVQAARQREAAAVEADLSPRERRLLRRQRAREGQEILANTLRRGMEDFFGRNYPWGIRYGHPLTPGQLAMTSQLSAFKELARAATNTAPLSANCFSAIVED